MYNLTKLRNFYYYIAMTISIRNFFESLQSVEEDDMTYRVVVLMIEDIRAFETKSTVFLFQN